MKLPNITPGPWERKGNLIFALTPYKGTSREMQRLCPDGINRFSCLIQQDNSEAAGGAPKAEIETNSRAIAAVPEMLAALEGLFSSPLVRDLAARNSDVFNLWHAARQALAKAGCTP